MVVWEKTYIHTFIGSLVFLALSVVGHYRGR